MTEALGSNPLDAGSPGPDAADPLVTDPTAAARAWRRPSSIDRGSMGANLVPSEAKRMHLGKVPIRRIAASH
jgi:hypothetical protein